MRDRPAVTVVGDALLDRDVFGSSHRLCPDAPAPVVSVSDVRVRAGGAGLAATMLARDGFDVTLITALGDDDAGRRLAVLLDAAHVRLVDVGTSGATHEKTRIMAGRQVVARLDVGDDGRIRPVGDAADRALDGAAAVLVSDYGIGISRVPRVREALARWSRAVPVVWDPHPRGASPTGGTLLATPNASEAGTVAGAPTPHGVVAAAAVATRVRARWRTTEVVVTMGADGAVLVGAGSMPFVVPAPARVATNPCGAGDRFASCVTGRLARGDLPTEAVVAAVRTASEFVAGGGLDELGRPDRDPTGSSALETVEAVRRRSGCVVATSGCFDLLHAGHVATLQAARALGDCLVVLLNSDASVRRLKGPGRPLVAQEDRATVLRGLDAVDAVELFDEDTPVAALERLRPDVFAKGGDYGLAELPEAHAIRRWGGRAVIVPYLQGRSTSLLVEEARRDH
jgi:rfaE bifunctional protein nucleotidyltransferase chain/domain/rfaE bifunctional protein kinase chain/domain